MGCSEVKRVIYFFLDGALSETKSKALKSHFGLCPECDQRREIQKRLRQFVIRKIERVKASERFKVRLERSLRGLSAQI